MKPIHDLSLFQQLIETILDPKHPVWSLRDEILRCTHIINTHALYQFNPNQDIAYGETRTAHGLALSPTQAAMCAQDFCRTVVFLRGLHAAIQEVLSKKTHRPVKVLYAGCGPYALLAVPLMSLFSSDQLQFTLLECHLESLQSAQSVIEGLGFSQSISQFIHINACEFQIATHETPDIILSETMNAALEKEPQVAVFRHLYQQAPDALLIPQSIRLNVVLVDPSKEFHVPKLNEHEVIEFERKRMLLGTAFELNADTIRSWITITHPELPGNQIRVHNLHDKTYTPMLFTEIQVYAEHRLKEYDSGLTIPRTLHFEGDFQDKKILEFSYQLGEYPKLVVCQS